MKKTPTRKNVSAQPAATLPKLAYTVPEAAQVIQVCEMSIYRLIARGKLKACGGLRHKRIAVSEVNRFLTT